MLPMSKKWAIIGSWVVVLTSNPSHAQSVNPFSASASSFFICIKSSVYEYDDGVSDAKTISVAISRLCRGRVRDEFRKLVTAQQLARSMAEIDPSQVDSETLLLVLRKRASEHPRT